MSLTRERKPVILDGNAVLCINVYRTKGTMLSEIFVQGYLDEQAHEDAAAQTLVDAIREELSVSMMWALRAALAREIDLHNTEFGTSFPHDKP